MIRVLIFLGIVLVLFLPFNWLTVRQLLRIHPRRKRWIVGAAIAGNLMWPFFPLLRSLTDLSRVARAILAPLWFGWTCFALLYSVFLFLLVLAWIPFRRRPFAQFAHWPSRILLMTLGVGFVIGYLQALVPHAMPQDETVGAIQSLFSDPPTATSSIASLVAITVVALWAAARTVERREYVLQG